MGKHFSPSQFAAYCLINLKFPLLTAIIVKESLYFGHSLISSLSVEKIFNRKNQEEGSRVKINLSEVDSR